MPTGGWASSDDHVKHDTKAPEVSGKRSRTSTDKAGGTGGLVPTPRKRRSGGGGGGGSDAGDTSSSSSSSSSGAGGGAAAGPPPPPPGVVVLMEGESPAVPTKGDAKRAGEDLAAFVGSLDGKGEVKSAVAGFVDTTTDMDEDTRGAGGAEEKPLGGKLLSLLLDKVRSTCEALVGEVGTQDAKIAAQEAEIADLEAELIAAEAREAAVAEERERAAKGAADAGAGAAAQLAAANEKIKALEAKLAASGVRVADLEQQLAAGSSAADAAAAFATHLARADGVASRAKMWRDLAAQTKAKANEGMATSTTSTRLR